MNRQGNMVSKLPAHAGLLCQNTSIKPEVMRDTIIFLVYMQETNKI